MLFFEQKNFPKLVLVFYSMIQKKSCCWRSYLQKYFYSEKEATNLVLKAKAEVNRVAKTVWFGSTDIVKRLGGH
jgi:hypothetical protein